jgi:hypothetical protein
VNLARECVVPYYPGTSTRLMLTNRPPEILLHPGLTICPYYPLTYRLIIVSFLDIPELSLLASTCHYLASLAADPILQRTRLLIVPSRVSHSLFGIGPEGSPLGPTHCFGSCEKRLHEGLHEGLGH